MSEAARKKSAPAKGNASKKKKPPPAKAPERGSEDIERAVYDGMQDLRAGKSA